MEIPNSSKLWAVARWVFCKHNCSIAVLKKSFWHDAWSFPSSSFFTNGHINITVLFIEIITKATIFKSNLLCAKLSASYILFHSILKKKNQPKNLLQQQKTLKVRWVSQRGQQRSEHVWSPDWCLQSLCFYLLIYFCVFCAYFIF